MRGCTFICLGRRTVEGDVDRNGGEGTQRHRHGQEGAGLSEYGQWTVTDRDTLHHKALCTNEQLWWLSNLLLSRTVYSLKKIKEDA